MSVVCSHNEWDPLEEVIVGSVLGAAEPGYEPSLGCYFAPSDPKRRFQGGRPDANEVAKAQAQLDGFADLLRREGIIVRRPDFVDQSREQHALDFTTAAGGNTACPRDVLLVVGDEIIEAPMARRCRYYEYRAYRSLVKSYFRQGARWTSAPKPSMSDELYRENYIENGQKFDPNQHPVLSEFEPCFDAACFARLGRDIFWQPDLVSNEFGRAWLARHLGPIYRIHRVQFSDRFPEHIDATLVPIRPGLVLSNPAHPCLDETLALFAANHWEVVPAVRSVRRYAAAMNVSEWISMNILSLDERTVVVEAEEGPMIKLLESLGCRVLTCPFDQVYKFGGSFHCCTSDIRRRGSLQSYFPNLDGAGVDQRDGER